MSLVVLALPAAADPPHLELAVIAAMAVPVVGAVLSSPGPRTIGRIPDSNLRRALVISQILAGLAALVFTAAVLLGVLAEQAQTEVIFTGLVGGTLGALSLLIGRRAAGARGVASDAAMVRDDATARFALVTNLVDGIQDRAMQDQVRADAAKQLVRALANDRESGAEVRTETVPPPALRKEPEPPQP